MNLNRKPKVEFCERQGQLPTGTGGLGLKPTLNSSPAPKAELNSRQSETSMIERHRSEHRSITTERLPQFSQVKGGPDPRQANDASETNSSSNQARHRDWVLIAILIFVLFAWAVFAFCIYDIWAKTRG